jgi:DNA-binding NarL/FixJ family response regulator
MQRNGPIRVALVNDYQVVVWGLARMLEPFSDRIKVVELASNQTPEGGVDIVLYDTFAAKPDGVDNLVWVLSKEQIPRLVFYSWTVDPDSVVGVVTGGADGQLSKGLSATELVDALERVYAGDLVVATRPPHTQPRDEPGDWPGRVEGLTSREAEIIALVTQGLSNQEIAECAFLSINTVKSYIRSSYRKMGVRSRSRAVLWGVAHGFGHERGRSQNPPTD